MPSGNVAKAAMGTTQSKNKGDPCLSQGWGHFFFMLFQPVVITFGRKPGEENGRL